MFQPESSNSVFSVITNRLLQKMLPQICFPTGPYVPVDNTLLPRSCSITDEVSAALGTVVVLYGRDSQRELRVP
ncbi:hypothetical protein TNCV_575281 [Trichonephila clavipes]|nr:hypothetical protein TNCV_575281 [Trichonephila clavipes]